MCPQSQSSIGRIGEEGIDEQAADAVAAIVRMHHYFGDGPCYFVGRIKMRVSHKIGRRSAGKQVLRTVIASLPNVQRHMLIEGTYAVSVGHDMNESVEVGDVNNREGATFVDRDAGLGTHGRRRTPVSLSSDTSGRSSPSFRVARVASSGR